MSLVAVGQDVGTRAVREGSAWRADRGASSPDERLRAAGLSNVFVGGDCQTGPATVIRAIAAGKVAARNIDEHLGFHHKLACEVRVPSPVRTTARPRGAWSWGNGRRASASAIFER